MVKGNLFKMENV